MQENRIGTSVYMDTGQNKDQDHPSFYLYFKQDVILLIFIYFRHSNNYLIKL